MIPLNYYERVTAFLLEYINALPVAFEDDSICLSKRCIQGSIEILLEEEVFESWEEMKRCALKKWQVILHDELFKETEDGK